ncbi:MAG: galactonate dehydratase [Chloroflexota bacterium]|nr:galactonate dehydratase [Chloroflexia bacterium]MDQ3443048.1 galactonate dehydratase [Chloroflexota bacterium]
MKITRISSLVVNANMRNWIFVKVETDQDGLYGWGESTLEWKTAGVVGSIEDISRLLIGEDPRRIEHLYQIMTRQYFWRAGIEGMSAISGIEQALWDIKGKALDVPVYELLGGRVRDTVRLYNHLGGGQMNVMYESTETTAFAENALAIKESGYTAIKFMAVPCTAPVEGRRQVRQAARYVEAIRNAVGDEMDLMVDLHGRTWPAMGIAYCQALEPYGLLFFEEPCPTEDIDATLQVTRQSKIPIATGERLVGMAQFRELISRRACHIIQPDLSHCGGLWEARKIAAMAEAHQIAVAPHNPNGPIATAAAIHFAAATPNWIIQEAITNDVPWRNDVVINPVEVVSGHAAIPTRAGLGIDINEDEAARHPFKPEAMQRSFHADGAVADW